MKNRIPVQLPYHLFRNTEQGIFNGQRRDIDKALNSFYQLETVTKISDLTQILARLRPGLEFRRRVCWSTLMITHSVWVVHRLLIPKLKLLPPACVYSWDVTNNPSHLLGRYSQGACMNCTIGYSNGKAGRYLESPQFTGTIHLHGVPARRHVSSISRWINK